jgi:hypothetical protein
VDVEEEGKELEKGTEEKILNENEEDPSAEPPAADSEN